MRRLGVNQYKQSPAYKKKTHTELSQVDSFVPLDPFARWLSGLTMLSLQLVTAVVHAPGYDPMRPSTS